MSSRPWMPFYVGDYLSKTSHLTTVQHGAYFLLILHYWANGRLPTTDKELMAIARMSETEWAGNCYAIAKFFDSNWRHPRIEEELIKYQNIRSKRSLAGLKGAWGKHKKQTENFLANANTITVTNKKEKEVGRDRNEDLSPSETAALETLRRHANGRGH
jgi:uncharacterized protein YdaU (DUF1376 family)